MDGFKFLGIMPVATASREIRRCISLRESSEVGHHLEVATHQQSRAADDGRYKEATGTESIAWRRGVGVEYSESAGGSSEQMEEVGMERQLKRKSLS